MTGLRGRSGTVCRGEKKVWDRQGGTHVVKTNRVTIERAQSKGGRNRRTWPASGKNLISDNSEGGKLERARKARRILGEAFEKKKKDEL